MTDIMRRHTIQIISGIRIKTDSRGDNKVEDASYVRRGKRLKVIKRKLSDVLLEDLYTNDPSSPPMKDSKEDSRVVI